MNVNFNPSRCRKDSTFKGLPLDRPIPRQKLVNGTDEIFFASIPKENLSFDDFQRPKDSVRSDKIATNFHKDFAVANVAEELFNGKWYYCITDAQQRSYANPQDSIASIITNGISSAHAFLLGNSNGKPLSKDDHLWARYKMGLDSYVWFFNTIIGYGFNPHRQSGDEGKQNVKNEKFVGTVGLHDTFEKITKGCGSAKERARLKHEFELLNGVDSNPDVDALVEQVSREKFSTICEIMTSVWDVDDFLPSSSAPANQRTRRKSGYRDVWFAMVDTVNEIGWGEQESIIENLSKGMFRKNNKGAVRQEPCLSLEDVVSHAFRYYPEIIAVSGGEGSRQKAYEKVLYSVYRTGLTAK